MTTERLLTHAFFLCDDPIEQQIMKPYPPLGILYLAAAVKRAGIDIEIFDTTFQTRSGFLNRLDEGTPGIVGIYTTHMTRRTAVFMIREARQRNWTILLGGPDSANYPDRYLASGADAIVTGEGEMTLVELLDHLKRNNPRNLHGIPGVIFRDAAGSVIRNSPRSLTEIDSIPWPDRGSVNIRAYLDVWQAHHGYSSLNMITSRGCTFSCRWCSHAVFGNTRRQRDPIDCADEVESILQAYNPSRLWYSDDVFTFDSDWLRRFADELNRRGIRIPFETITRADRLQDDATVKILSNMGCYRIWIGSESGSDRVLRAMNRGVTASEIRRAVMLAKREGIETGVFLMWGYPGETLADIESTVDHVCEIQPDIFFTTVVHPIKNTPYYTDVQDRLMPPDDWENASDKDIVIRGMPTRDYFRFATRWLKSAVDAAKYRSIDSKRAADSDRDARTARAELLALESGGQSE